MALVQDAYVGEEFSENEAARESGLDLLAARTARGDALAFELVYNQTVDEIYRYLNGQLHDPARAEDLTANVFLKAWTAAKTYRAGSNRYRAWLFTIAHNELRDAWRRERKGIDINNIEVAEDASPPESIVRAATLRRVTMAMGSLTEEQRQVVILRFFNDLPHAEIARILKKREGAVRGQLLRALRHMRKVMDDAAAP